MALRYWSLFVYCSFTLLLHNVVDSAKILIAFPSAAKSHNILGQALGIGLAKRGHDVTMFSAYSIDDPPENYTQLVMGDMWTQLAAATGDFDGDMFSMYKENPFHAIYSLYQIGSILAKCAFDDPAFAKLYNSTTKYDIVISETFVNEAFFLLAHHFNAKLVVFSTIGPSEWTNFLTANPHPFAYIPNTYMDYTDSMSFFQRAYNTLVNSFNYLLCYYYHIPRQNELAHQYFPDAPDLGDFLEENVSLVLLNSHISLKNAQPLVPNMIEIGGFHVFEPKPLPKDLKEILDNATDGVIYFAMGSNLKGANLPEHARNVLLKVLGERNETVLWKWEDPNLPGKPDNVIIYDWFPQADLLAHPNVKLFITHGGILSTLESISRGVPILGIPIFGDQSMNMRKAALLGYGLRLDLDTLNYEDTKWAVNEIISNPTFAENAKYRSRALNDQPRTPMDNAEFWVDYVVRHNGAKHLQVHALKMPFYKVVLLDVIAFYLVITFGTLWLIYFVIKRSINMMRTKSKEKSLE